MDWFSSPSRPTKSLEFYQQKLLNFLFSAEGREDIRCLNIPFPQLGFYSPMHFMSCIPSEMCEPFRNDKLYLATSGEIRKGDKVLLVQDNGDENIVQSAVFKGRRIGRSGEPEILLDGHRRTYSEDEVVPYKAYLRDQLGTALVPEDNYVISEDGTLEWEEPTWEPGQEVYYKPEKRWGTILSDELSPRGRILVNLKMEQTNFKKEKIIKIPVDDLKASSIPVRIPLRKPKRKVGSVDDLIQKVNEEFKEIYQVDGDREEEMEVEAANTGRLRKMETDTEIREKERMGDHGEDNKNSRKDTKKDYETKASSSSTPVKKVTMKSDGGRRSETPTHSNGDVMTREKYEDKNDYAVVKNEKEHERDVKEIREPEYATMRKKDEREEDKGGTSIMSVLRPKRTKRPKERPVTEYITDYSKPSDEQPPTLPARNRKPKKMETVPVEVDPPKFKSCNNLAAGTYSDDDLEPFELMNYTNSLRSSARKIIQRQLAEGKQDRSASLKLKHAAEPRKHVTEVFSWNDDKGRMSRRTSETSAVTQRRKETHLDEPSNSSDHVTYTTLVSLNKTAATPVTKTLSTPVIKGSVPKPDRSSTMSPSHSMMQSRVVEKSSPSPSSSNNLSKSVSQPDIRRNVIDSAKKPSAAPEPPPKNLSKSQNPLDYNFLPLSSSELVKKQLAIVNRVLHEPQVKGGVLYQDYLPSSKTYKNGKMFPNDDPSSTKLHTCASSDSSSHDNDSGRGSYQFLPETVKGTEELVGMDHVMDNRSSPSHRSNFVRSPVQESVYANENMTIYSQNGVQSPTEAPREDSPTRRYAKNRSASRNSTQRYTGAIEDNESEEEFTLPMPFNPGNLSPVAGYGRGIQGATNSSFADAALYALFSCSNIFDNILLFSKPGVEKGIKRDVRRILRDKIVMPLRTSAYCKSDNVTYLREAMLPLSSKMHSNLMDAEEFLYLLFDSALNTESFIEFSNGTKDFMHQIIARPKDRSKSQTVQFMLETSMGTSNLKFKSVPKPALFLCMPRCKGRLVYYEAIIPSLHLNITRLLHKGPKQCVCEMAATLECILCHQKNGDLSLDFCQNCKGIADQVHFRLDHNPILIPKSQKDEILNLHSIICTRGNRYVCFVKVSEQRLAPWLFFDPMAGDYPEVTLLEDFGKWLDSLEKQPGHYKEFSKLHPLLKRIMTDSHIYIYSKTHMVEGTEHKEIMRI